MNNKDNPENSIEPSQDGKQEPVKVVMADDDKDDQDIFKEAIKETDVPTEVTTVNDGKELIEHLKDKSTPNPDVIFVDINMPKKDGKEALREIKNDKDLKDIPTVMYTTSTNQRDIKDTFEAGADLYVPKPVSFAALVLILKKIFFLHWAGYLLKPLWNKFILTEKDLTDKKAK